MNKERGKFLTIMLVLTAFSASYALYSIADINSYQEIYKNLPSWLGSFVFIGVLVDVATLIGIWLWKKLGVYLYALSAGIGVLVEALILQLKEPAYSWINFIMYGLVFWAISRKWKHFN